MKLLQFIFNIYEDAICLLECLKCSKKLTKYENGLELKLLAIITVWLGIHMKGVRDCRAAPGAFYPQLNAPAEPLCYFLQGCVIPLLGVHTRLLNGSRSRIMGSCLLVFCKKDPTFLLYTDILWHNLLLFIHKYSFHFFFLSNIHIPLWSSLDNSNKKEI